MSVLAGQIAAQRDVVRIAERKLRDLEYEQLRIDHKARAYSGILLPPQSSKQTIHEWIAAAREHHTLCHCDVAEIADHCRIECFDQPWPCYALQAVDALEAHLNRTEGESS